MPLNPYLIVTERKNCFNAHSTTFFPSKYNYLSPHTFNVNVNETKKNSSRQVIIYSLTHRHNNTYQVTPTACSVPGIIPVRYRYLCR